MAEPERDARRGTKLIVLRGPSGAGKTTIARRVAAASSRSTAVVERDHYMQMFNRWGFEPTPDQDLLELVIMRCLDAGIDVIFEGNFKVSTHGDLLKRILDAHPDDNYVFYLDVSLDECIRRHRTRPQAITEAKMAELYPTTTPLGLPGEVVVSQDLAEDEVVKLIMSSAGLPDARTPSTR